MFLKSFTDLANVGLRVGPCFRALVDLIRSVFRLVPSPEVHEYRIQVVLYRVVRVQRHSVRHFLHKNLSSPFHEHKSPSCNNVDGSAFRRRQLHGANTGT